MFFFVILVAFWNGFIYEVLLLFAIVLIHELGHAITAHSLGWRLKKIELLPFGGVAEVDEHGNRPLKEEALVILAGPLMNVFMLGWAFLCLHYQWWDQSFAFMMIDYNLIILLFNLLPIWPLDGGKLMQVLLSVIFPYRKAIRFSFYISVIIFLCYLVINFSNDLI